MSGSGSIRPRAGEFAEFYAGYVAAVPDGDVRALLASQLGRFQTLLRLGDERATQPYAPGKWSTKDVVLHLADAERVFAFRALWFARGEASPLPGFDQDPWVRAGGATTRRLEDLLQELELARQCTIALVDSFSAEDWLARGVASGAQVSVRALVWVIAGHAEHHLGVLKGYGIGVGEPRAR